MNLSKPYTYALLAVVFLASCAVGYVSVSSGLIPEHLRDPIMLVGFLIGGSASAFAMYRKTQSCDTAR